MRKALVNPDGLIENIIVLGPTYRPPEGYTLIDPPTGSNPGDMLEDGKLVKPPEPLVSITQKQIRLALNDLERLDDVDAYIARIADDKERKAAEIVWEYGQPYSRGDLDIRTILEAIGLDDATIDDLWRSAQNK